MKEDGFEFLELFGNIDETFIFQALHPWEGQTGRYAAYHMGKKVACLFIILMLGFCMVFHNQVYAAISRFTTMIGEILGLSDDLMPYTDIIHTTQRQDGVEITLNEVIWTGSSFLASVHAEGIDESDGASMSAGENIEINGQKMICDSLKVYRKEGIGETGSNYVIEWNYDSSMQINGKVEIQLEIVLHRHMDDLEGQAFVFAFSASQEELQKNTFCMEVNQKIEIGNGEAILKEISLNSVVSSIRLECKDISLEKSQYYMKVTDMDGKEFLYSLIGMQDGMCTFQNDRDLPSMENKWLDVQMYALPYEWEEDDKNSGLEGGQLGNVFQIDNEMMKPVGEKIRIEIEDECS